MEFLAVVKANASPRSLTFLTILSLILSLIILLVSTVNDSTVVLCLNAIATALCISYHVVVIEYVRRRRWYSAQRRDIDVIDETKSTTTDLFLTLSIAYCSVVLALWSGAFVFAAETALVGRKDVEPVRVVGPWSNGVQIAVVFLIAMELGVMALYLRSCFLVRFRPKSTEGILTPLIRTSTRDDYNIHSDSEDIKKYSEIDNDPIPVSSRPTPRLVNSPIRILHSTFVKLPPPAFVNNKVRSPYGSWIFLTPKREST